MLAFAHAIDVGVMYLESDVHATADGVAVLAHDPSLDRVAGLDVRIEATMARDLAQIDLGSAQHVPELREALLAFPDARFNLDLKSDAAVVPAVRAITEAQALSRVLVTSFDERRRRRAVELLPGVASSASRSVMLRAIAALQMRLDAMLPRILTGIDAVQIPRRAGALQLVTPRTVAAFERCGVEVHVWTINDADEMRELLALGVHGIVTDRADIAMRVVAEG